MGDSFFVNPISRKRRHDSRQPNASRQTGMNAQTNYRANKQANARKDVDEDITSESEDEAANSGRDESESESDNENETDKRRRLAKEYLASLETEYVDGFDAKDMDEDIIARRLKTDAAEQQGHIFRDLKTANVSAARKIRVQQQKHLTAVATAHNNVYMGSKDGILSKWTFGGSGSSGGKLVFQKQRKITNEICRGSVLCVAVNIANKLVVTGHSTGFAVHNAESLETLKEFKTHGEVLSLVFRRNTSDLYVGGSDLRLRTYDLTQWAFVETLHGHQDAIMSVSALSQERCVSVGARDRTVIFWKIPEESRLTLRGGDTKLAAKLASQLNNPHSSSNTSLESLVEAQREARETILEGSIDCCAMLDHQLFVTGSDNGNVCLWSSARKKPQFQLSCGHGKDAPLSLLQASGEKQPGGGKVEIPPQLPRAVTAVCAVPFSNTFFTASWDGVVKMWTLTEDKRSFELVREVECGSGIVTSLCVAELHTEGKTQEFAVVACVSREPRLGRWLVKSGRDRLVSFSISAEV